MSDVTSHVPTFAERLQAHLRAWCGDTGKSERQFAREAGIDAGTLNRLKHGRELPSPATIKAIVDQLGLERPEAVALYRAGDVPIAAALLRDGGEDGAHAQPLP